MEKLPFLQAIYLQCSKLGANKCIEKTTNVQSGCFQIRESERKSSEKSAIFVHKLALWAHIRET